MGMLADVSIVAAMAVPAAAFVYISAIALRSFRSAPA
jgi:hypothetical protein